jgi:AraC-like DNA-binding protein
MYLPFVRRETGAFPRHAAATAEIRTIGDITITRTRAPKVSEEPDERGYVDPGDAVVWAFILSGTIRVRRSSGETENAAGTLSVDHMPRIREFSVSPGFSAISVRMERSALQIRGRELDALTDGVFPLTSGLPSMLASVAANVLRSDIGRGTGTSSEAAASQALVALTNGFAVDATLHRLPPDATRNALLVRARRHIDVFSADPTLTVASVARSMQVSVRTLQKAFEEDGDSPGRRIARCRLDRAAGLLRDIEGTRHLSIEAIGRQSGFGSATSFSRAFRERFGISPREYRALVVAGAPLPA